MVTSERQRGYIMLKQIVILTALSTAGIMATADCARAISEPDVVYSGTALNAVNGSTITLTQNGKTSALATYKIGSNRKYLLRVPMENAFGTRSAGTAKTGDAAVIAINGVPAASVLIPKFGTIVTLDLGTRDTAQWAKDHPGDDGSGDMNRNGISDLNEYLGGKDPAACVWSQVNSSTLAASVYHPAVLMNCLTDAGMDKMHNLIRVARGTYPGNFRYKAAWGEDYDLTLIGGYDPAGSGERSYDPALTVLNGDTDSDNVGNGVVLSLDTSTNSSAGTVHIESFTFKKGLAPLGYDGNGYQNGGGIQAGISQGGLELTGNIFRDNKAETGGGLSIECRGSGTVTLINNILFGNSAANAAATYVTNVSDGDVQVTLLNNTIVDNAATVNGDGRSLLIKTAKAAHVDITNNIISGFASVTGKDIFINSTDSSTPPVITHNAITVSDMLATGYVADASNGPFAQFFADPVGGNYRLTADSRCIDKGIGHTLLPEKDVVGAGRTANGIPDLGAYEFISPTLPGYTVTGTVLSGTGTIVCTGNGSSSTCTLSPAAGWYTASLADNSADVFSQLLNDKYSLTNITQNHTVGVRFQEYFVQRLSGVTPRYYIKIQEAFNSATSSDKIRLLNMIYPEQLIYNQPIDILLEGGYASGFGSTSGSTVIKGKVTISKGKVTVRNITIR
jgi:hypothetical protein